MESRHLADIIRQHNRTANVQVVFCDVEHYSSRRTLTQLVVIDGITECIAEALEGVGKHHLAYAQANDLNFKTDIISIPTGDGAAVVFSFDGLHDIHLNFATHLLEAAWKRRQGPQCVDFDRHGWCKCYPYFNLRVGIAEGKGIVFTDVNRNYNCAGGVMNLASRVMCIAGRNQIVFTEAAYRQIIDMIPDSTFIKQFAEFRNIEIKHREKINVYQYVGAGEPFLNAAPPEDLLLMLRLEKAMSGMRGMVLPVPDFSSLNTLDGVQGVETFIEGLANVLNAMNAMNVVNVAATPAQTHQLEGIAEDQSRT